MNNTPFFKITLKGLKSMGKVVLWQVYLFWLLLQPYVSFLLIRIVQKDYHNFLRNILYLHSEILIFLYIF